MKCEGMPTQRHEEKRVEKCGREREKERERVHARGGERDTHKEREREREGGRKGEREREHTRGGEREKAVWLLLVYVFPPPRPALCKLGLARSAVCST